MKWIKIPANSESQSSNEMLKHQFPNIFAALANNLNMSASDTKLHPNSFNEAVKSNIYK